MDAAITEVNLRSLWESRLSDNVSREIIRNMRDSRDGSRATEVGKRVPLYREKAAPRPVRGPLPEIRRNTYN